MLGQEGDPTWVDKAIQKGAKYSSLALLGSNVLRNVVPHLTRRGASRSLREARNLGESRNIGSLDINPETIEDLRQFLPNTAPYRNAIESSYTGEYQPLFNLQSDVGKHASDYARSLFSSAERAHRKRGISSKK